MTMIIAHYHKPAFLALFMVLFVTSISSTAAGQTCGCAGAPIISAQDMASSKEGQVHVGLTYDYHDISSLYIENEKLDNTTFQRSTQSLLFEINYGITDRLLLSGLLSSVRKARFSGRSLQNKAVTRGLGGSLFMLKYTLHQNVMMEQYQLTAGGGVKIPVGPTNLSGEITAYAPDMQPSTGAVDYIGWLHFSKTYLPSSTVNTFATLSYRYTGTGDFINRPNYKFGNQFIAKLGFSNQIISKLKYSILTKYRYVSRFEWRGIKQPNTGGDWINIVPGLNYKPRPDISLRLSGDIPLYRYLNGQQATTRFAVQASIFYTF